jgi:hypothetical protein
MSRRQKYTVTFTVTLEQMTEMLIDYGECVESVSAVTGEPTRSPNQHKWFRVVATGSKNLKGLHAIIFKAAQTMPTPLSRDALTEKAGAALVEAGYSTKSASSGISQLIKKGNLKEAKQP